jgi:nitroreductase
MEKSNDDTVPAVDVSLMDAIYNRQSIRDFEDKKVDRYIIDSLIDAATRAPTAMYQEPWAFMVIDDKKCLQDISDRSKVLMEIEARKNSDSEQVKADVEALNKPGFNIFYEAQAMIVIYSKYPGAFVAADCWLAAENLMLAAYAHGLGSCCVGLALSPLNDSEVKKELGIPEDMVAIAPMIIGWPSKQTSKAPRQEPEVYFYK